jgi:putative hydrolase
MSLSRAIPRPNREAAKVFERVADLLELLETPPGSESHRIGAYRRAAASLRHTRRDIWKLAVRGPSALQKIPGIGEALAAELIELYDTGKLRLLDRLEARAHPQAVLETLPGVGPVLAGRIIEELHLDSLEALEVAAHDGRLVEVRGVGEKTVFALKKALARRLSRVARTNGLELRTVEPPPVALLLEVDEKYRSAARKGRLHEVAPHRFNPSHRPWLPILETERDGYRLTVAYSNSPRAHQLGKDRDWVVVHFERDGGQGSNTVVTEYRGPDAGRRVVRGRERETHEHYREHPPPRIRLPMPDFLLPNEPHAKGA